MTRLSHFLLFLAMGTVASPAFAASHHTILYYISAAPISVDTVRPLVGYLDPQGNAIDWMYDGFIVFSINIHGSSTTSADLDTFHDSLFAGGQLETLRQVVASLRGELGDPDYRLKVYLAAPYASGEGAKVRMQALIDAWPAADELELAGFYWGYQESVGSTQSANTIRDAADYVHAQSFELIWIPYFNASGVDAWASYHFDRATLQPNFAFNDVDLSRFLATDERRRAYGTSGVEIEIAEVTNPQVGGADPRITNANHYLSAADTMNWTAADQITYYHGSNIAAYAADASRREIYDRVYRFIAAHPQHPTVLYPRDIVASADGFVDMADGYQSAINGHLEHINLGSNAYPNVLRGFVRFPLDGFQGAERPLAVQLRLQQRGFPYGSKLDDIRISVVSDAWDEDTLAGNNQPAMGAHFATHRFLPESSYPFEHIMDVTAPVIAALDANESSISFGFSRAVEDGTEAEVQLHAREAGDAVAPRLVAQFREPAPTADAGPDVAVDAPADAEETGVEDGGGVDSSSSEGGPDASESDGDVSVSGSATNQDDGEGCACHAAAERRGAGRVGFVLGLLSLAFGCRRGRFKR